MSWVLNDAPPKFGNELEECQRSLVPVTGAFAYGVLTGGKKNLVLAVVTPVPMRANPTVSGVIFTGVRTTAGSNIVANITGNQGCIAYPNGIVLVTLSSDTFLDEQYVNNTPIVGYFTGLFSAEL